MSVNLTTAEYLSYEARQHSRKKADFIAESSGEPVEVERDLHDQIETHCIREGYLYYHDRMDKPTTGEIGRADFTIFMPNQKVCFIEAKSKRGKATTAQLAKLAHARKLGFVAEICDNFEAALAVMRKAAE